MSTKTLIKVNTPEQTKEVLNFLASEGLITLGKEKLTLEGLVMHRTPGFVKSVTDDKEALVDAAMKTAGLVVLFEPTLEHVSCLYIFKEQVNGIINVAENNEGKKAFEFEEFEQFKAEALK